MRILIVDDSTEKIDRVANILVEQANCDHAELEEARNIIAAKKALANEYFDLVVLDVALPLRVGDKPDRSGGLELLREITRRDRYVSPGHIVGLTGYPELVEPAKQEFGSSLWSIILYEANSTAWEEQLVNRIEHIRYSQINAKIAGGLRNNVCILTALNDPELQAVIKILDEVQEKDYNNDPTIYYEGYYESNAKRWRVIAACATEMGPSDAAALAMKMCMAFRPRYLIMAGILAGVEEEVALGDIVVANPTWQWETGKIREKNGKTVFEQAPLQCDISPELNKVVRWLEKESFWRHEAKEAWQGNAPGSELQLVVGPVATGSSVLANRIIVEGIQGQHRKLVGMDMEAHSVMVAARNAPKPRPEAIAIKSVCDFADSNKNDKYRKYAAYTSAMAVRELLRRLMGPAGE